MGRGSPEAVGMSGPLCGSLGRQPRWGAAGTWCGVSPDGESQGFGNIDAHTAFVKEIDVRKLSEVTCQPLELQRRGGGRGGTFSPGWCAPALSRDDAQHFRGAFPSTITDVV